MLSEADIFVGTFSSNVARRVVLMRDANGLERDTAMSVDDPDWYAGRRQLGCAETQYFWSAGRNGTQDKQLLQ